MKKIIALFLALSMVMLAVASCGGTSDATSGTTASTSATTSQSTQGTSQSTTSTTQTTQTTQNTTTSPSVVTPTFPKVKKAEENSLVFHLDFTATNLVDGTYYKDISGNGHVGVVHGTVNNVSGSVQFTGNGSSYISIADHEDLNFSADQSFTLEIAFKAEPKNSWACLVQKGLGDNKPAYYGFWLDSSNQLNMGVGTTSTSNKRSDDVVGTEWHQAIIIQDAKAGTILFYLDGELQATTFPKNSKVPVSPMDLISTGEDFTIGTNFSDHFTGLIDYVKLYNYAVPEKQLLTNYPGQVFNLDREYYEYTDSETGESNTLPYRIYYPQGYRENDGKKYPVILSLHGHGECGTDNVGQLRNSGGYVEYLMSQENCIIVVPQCACDGGINTEWVASEHHFDNTNRTLSEKGTITMRALISLMKEIAKDEKVDTDKISAFGFSMGAFGVWELLQREPELFAAAVILAGAGSPALADKVLDIDILAFHGKADEVVPVSGLELMDAAIKELGGTKFKATYFDGVDHNGCYSAASSTQDLFAWLLSQTKAD